ncbi:2745_t:CDS:2 [Cetraspora pellucida]|uniref:2745_t:CDS:1 n=1 Tax=Cetraspora pellucida TaxID=1433469 RepID=A0ACA9K2K2_9GLOM|nr:2745_t:CDS:2 [Cetraspora pellucida]
MTEFDNRISTILQQCLFDKQLIYFILTDVNDKAEYINEMSTYILHISSTLINRQKAIVDITDIKPFFDAEVSDNYFLADPREITLFKTILACILSTTLKSTSKFGFKNSVQYNNISKEKRLYTNILEYLSDKQNEMKKHLAPLKEKKEDINLVISSMGKGLLLLKAIEQVLENMKKEKHANRHTYEEANIKLLIKKSLASKPYLYKIPEPGKCFEYIVVKNDLSQRVGDKMEFLEVMKSLKKLKDSNKAGDSKADNSRVDEDDLNKDKEDKDKINKNELSKIRDALAQKSAEK